MNIRIGRIYYPVTTLGPGKRVGIWFCGCPFNCKGCLSEDLRESSNGQDISIDEIIKLINAINGKIDGITISGGEPFYQSEALFCLLKKLSEKYEDIIVFTGFKYEELLNVESSYEKKSLNYISLLIEGRFVEEKLCDDGLRGSTNQRIIQLKKIYDDEDFYTMKKRIQVVYANNAVIEIGIPGGNIQ